MAIIYNYPLNSILLAEDMLIGTSTKIVNGQPKNATKNFSIGDLTGFIKENVSLNDVLLVGNTSLLDAKIGKLYLYDTPVADYGNIALNQNRFSFNTVTHSEVFRAQRDMFSSFSSSGYRGSFEVSNITANRVWDFPNESGTVALLSDMPSAEWGSITGDIEDQTDLINYISSQVTTPALQDVIETGNRYTGSNGFTEFDTVGNLNLSRNDEEYIVNLGTYYGLEISTGDGDAGLIGIGINQDESNFVGLTRADGLGNKAYYSLGNRPDGYYDLATLDDITTPTLQEVTDEGNTITGVISIITLGDDNVSVADINQPEFGSGIGAYGLFANGDTNQVNYQYNKIYYADLFTTKNLQINYPASIVGANKVQTFQDADGTIALLSDVGVTAVTATSPITSSGGATPDISTSMATNKLIGRSTAGVGVMEEITIGTGLTLSGGTLNASATGGGIPHATASGTDTYTATVSGVTSYNDADAYLIRFTNGNTTGATLNINSLGAIPLYRNNDGVLIGGDIISGGEMLCIYNSTTNRFQVIGTAPNSLFAYVTNDDSVTLTKGMPVYAFSGTGDRMTVKRAFNTSDATSAQTVGLVLSTSIAANQKGLIMMQGLLDGLSILPTSTWADGDAVYLGATAGTITNVKPFAPNHLVYLGVVTTASNGSAGRMYVRVQNGYELQELHNVQAQSPSLNDTLWYDNTVSPAQWKTASIPTILGFTPEDVANKQTNLTASATKYPTVNAVNTGLALKQNILSYTPYRNIQTSQTVHTGTTVETVLFTATIPAGAFSSTDIIKVLFGTNKLNVAGTYSLRLRLNTTNTISGAPTIALYSGTNTAQVNVMMRNFNLNGGNLYGFPFMTSGMTDIVALGASLGSTTLNPANQFFIFATVTLNNSLDNFIGNMLSISN